MNYNERLNELREKRRELINKKQISVIFKESSDAKKFDREIREIDGYLYYFKDKIVNASTLNIKTISKVFTDLIRIYDGKNFVLRKMDYIDDTKKVILTSGNVRLLINKYRISEDARLSHINILQKEGNAIPLCWNNETNIFKLYSKKGMNNDLASTVKFNKFPYLKEFADFVISYKLETGIVNLNKVELDKLKKKFVYYHKDEIENYHNINKQNEKIEHDKQLEDNYDHMDKLLVRTLKDYNVGK